MYLLETIFQCMFNYCVTHAYTPECFALTALVVCKFNYKEMYFFTIAYN